jgi:photosystem II stability/assembly factor-like uncharacterized protein
MADGVVSVTRDAGRSWQERKVAAGSLISGIARAGQRWWATGGDGGIFGSDDDGETWQRVDTADGRLLTLRTKGQRGWIAGTRGLVFELDGGRWRRLRRVTEQDLEAIAPSESGEGAWFGGTAMTVVRVGRPTACPVPPTR